MNKTGPKKSRSDDKRNEYTQVHAVYEGKTEEDYFEMLNNCWVNKDNEPLAYFTSINNPSYSDTHDRIINDVDNNNTLRSDLINIAEGHKILHMCKDEYCGKYTAFQYVKEYLSGLWRYLYSFRKEKHSPVYRVMENRFNIWKGKFSKPSVFCEEEYVGEISDILSKIRQHLVACLEEKNKSLPEPEQFLDNSGIIQSQDYPIDEKRVEWLNNFLKEKLLEKSDSNIPNPRKFLEDIGFITETETFKNNLSVQYPISPEPLLIDRTFVVMDKDDEDRFEDLKDAYNFPIREVRNDTNFENYVNLCNSYNIKLLLSNPRFELWLLLHFTKDTGNITYLEQSLIDSIIDKLPFPQKQSFKKDTEIRKNAIKRIVKKYEYLFKTRIPDAIANSMDIYPDMTSERCITNKGCNIGVELDNLKRSR